MIRSSNSLSSDSVRSTPLKKGWFIMSPTILIGLRSRSSALTSVNQSSLVLTFDFTAWSRTQRIASTPSSYAAGRRCSGARRYSTDTTSAGELADMLEQVRCMGVLAALT
ncbi:hypothetical protein HanXRQr2_Chr04g0184571 [Helianthus annuus]|uniref:Uncharacterized protein n=1 Tax=Helianthus annuus TaxID=4232 RepID=A0A9K3JAM0_HELAN|nr:hypothetical protein HanXRQr2_Chr04g0184571 [Helianthus annuus]